MKFSDENIHTTVTLTNLHMHTGIKQAKHEMNKQAIHTMNK